MRDLYSRIRKVYVPAAIGAVGAGFAAASSAFAFSWPPTAGDLTTVFTDLGDNIGAILAVAVTAGLVIWGGVIAVQAAISFFSKFVKRATGA